MKFNSQICTTRKQSERLLSLGLKKETADMYRQPSWGGDKIISYYAPDIILFDNHFDKEPNDLPAWSLHRLIELAYGNWKEEIVPVYLGNSYDMLIGRIEFQVKQGTINEEYLV